MEQTVSTVNDREERRLVASESVLHRTVSETFGWKNVDGSNGTKRAGHFQKTTWVHNAETSKMSSQQILFVKDS